MNCRHCAQPLEHVFVDLGHQPPSNAYLSARELEYPETTFPMRAYVCSNCWLVQLPTHAAASELFTPEYAYFSSVSQSWVDHARVYVETMVKKYELNSSSLVVEVASNDGYLLQFVKERGIPCIGIEPTRSTAEAAQKRGVETWQEFFGVALARRLIEARGKVDLLVANNVLAHVPDINDFSAGIAEVLAARGVATLEFPHLLRLVQGLQFDTIYHEHYSYLSLHTISQIFESVGLSIVDVEQLSTHGGSLRIHAMLVEAQETAQASVTELLEEERQAGICNLQLYSNLQVEAERIKNDLLSFLLEQKSQGRKVAAYGAAAKGNTLLNFSGVRPDLIPFVCDAAPSKQHMFMPGSKIPIKAPSALKEARPDFVLILPWNIRDEIITSQSQIRKWGGRFVTAVPNLVVL